MIPLGYMAKRVATRPEWLKAAGVEEVLSVSSCTSNDFTDWFGYWRHNGYWLFDSPLVIQALAQEHSIELSDCRWFYYEGHDTDYDDNARAWIPYAQESGFGTSVQASMDAILRGYDVVSYSGGNSAEHSPLSCNHLAEEIATNRHCLLDSFDLAHQLTGQRRFANCEPGPYRIVAVYEIPQPAPINQHE